MKHYTLFKHKATNILKVSLCIRDCQRSCNIPVYDIWRCKKDALIGNTGYIIY